MSDGLAYLMANWQDPGAALSAGWKQGERDTVLRRFGKDPSNPQSLAALMQVDPRLGFQAQEWQAEQEDRARQRESEERAQHASSEKQRREMLLTGAKLIRELKPTDDATWQPVLATFRRYGYPTEGIPEHFDPSFVNQVINEANAFDPQKAPELINVAPGGHLIDPSTRQSVFDAPFKPEYHNVPEGTAAIPIGGPQGSVGQGGFDNIVKDWVLPTEGGYASSDGASGAPVNFGINQKANPDIDVSQLTPETAAALYRDRYWGPSGADQIQDPRVQAIHFDTAVNMGVPTAANMLKASGGDPQRYLQLREKRYRGIGGKSLPAWLERNQKLGQYTGVSGLPAGTIVNPKAPAQKDAPSGFRWKGDGNLEPIPGGPADKKTVTGLPKVPAATVKAYVDNNSSIRTIDSALSAVAAYPDGLGGWNSVTPDFVAQRVDQKGVDVRSKVSDIGSLLIHDRSGAAVTISETPRLKPFVPTVSDTPAAVKKKLENLKLKLVEMQQDFADAYSNEDGESMLTRIGQRRGAAPKAVGDGWTTLPSGLRVRKVK